MDADDGGMRRTCYTCRITDEDGVLPPPGSEPYLREGVFIEIHLLHKLVKPPPAADDDDFRVLNVFHLPPAYLGGYQFVVLGMVDFIRMFLSDMVPKTFENSVIGHVRRFGRSLAFHNKMNPPSRKFLPIFVDIKISTFLRPDENIDEVAMLLRPLETTMTYDDADSDDDNVVWSEEVLSIAVQALEKVTLDDNDDNRECSICLGTLPAGVQVARLPCSHIYHCNCIVDWLKKNISCPLCRSASPFPAVPVTRSVYFEVNYSC